GIRVVPLIVRFGSEELRTGVDLTTEEFWARMLAPGTPIPSTAAPSPGDFGAAFEAAFADGAEAVVCPVVGSTISGTIASATLAARDFPDREIHVIDTGSTSMATGLPAILAAEIAASGAAGSEVADGVRRRLPDIDLYVAVDSLDYLRKNGRLSAAATLVGTVLAIKPIITVRDGVILMAEKMRTRSKARERTIELITERPIERAFVMHTPTSTPAEVEAFRGSIVERAPGGIDPAAVSVGLIGASTGPHLGPDLMGAVFLRRR
ncbi:MAG: DegV family protein, partial [Chloroflexi bacterium]|nr:DegV family protein [Chloroflexota bacterium]